MPSSKRTRGPRRLVLGPVLGHTDHRSTRIWIQVPDDPRVYAVRVDGVGLFPFESTEIGGVIEFGTATARVSGLEPDRRYTYRIQRAGRFLAGARGSVRTLMPPESMMPLLFDAISCNGSTKLGAWQDFADHVERAQPSFIVMMGDQVYLDEDEPNIFRDHFDSRGNGGGDGNRTARRQAMAANYRANWSREPVARLLANTPCYMMWDDHDIRDGWGSVASDSPTLAAKYPRGAAIFRKSNAFFEDARDVFWHFQGCRNPRPGDHLDALNQPDPAFPNYVDGPLPAGTRIGMPFVFRCGRLLVMVLDSRGARDVFRADKAILGDVQWTFADQVLTQVPADIDALAVVTATPLASQDPDGQTQRLMGGRTDDVEAFRRGDEQELFHPQQKDSKAEGIVKSIVSAKVERITGTNPNLGDFQVNNIDEARDQWSHRASRPEQRELLKKAFAARLANLPQGSKGRELLFLSGDIHIGCTFEVSATRPVKAKATSLTSSGISQIEDRQPFIGVYVDESFSLAPGISAELKDVIVSFNFGVITVTPTGHGALIQTALAHEGNGFAFALDIKDLI
ncbi:MAG: alkaline phosphatase D family protein [Burkholderiales bacterium]|nr:alkaline phosphatase D family protein [Burkholderiales bacterium]